MRELTEKHHTILKYIIDYTGEVGYPPSFREIGERVNLLSSSTIHGHLERLKKQGYVHWVPGRPRTLTVIKQEETAS